MSEDWDPKTVAAECAATARAKTGPRPTDPPKIPITSKTSAVDEFRTELGTFKAGHKFSAGDAHAGGGVTKYKPEYAEQAEKLARMGATGHEIADFFNVSPSTFYVWRNVNEDFAEAVKIGWGRTLERATRSLYELAVGYDYVEEEAIKVKVGQHEEKIEIVEVRRHQPPNVTASMYVHNNRDPENWRHVRTLQVSGSIDHNITPDQARKELADFMTTGEIIDVTPTRLTLPESEGEIPAEDDI